MYKQIAAIIFLLLIAFGGGIQFGQQIHHYIEVPIVAYHRGVVSRFSTSEYRQQVRQLFDKNYSWMDLLFLESEMISYSKGNIPRYDDPLTMIANKPIKGRCGEFAILYTALLYAFDYKARLLVNVDGDHVWTEIFLNGTWMHIDPTEACIFIKQNPTGDLWSSGTINNPHRYSWCNSTKCVAAFEGNICGNVLVSDVTEFYRSDLNDRC